MRHLPEQGTRDGQPLDAGVASAACFTPDRLVIDGSLSPTKSGPSACSSLKLLQKHCHLCPDTCFSTRHFLLPLNDSSNDGVILLHSLEEGGLEA